MDKMADYDGVDMATTERVLAAGGVSKRRRNLSNKTGGDKLKSTQTKSPKRRPGTPEPQKRVMSDESERETSDSETPRYSHSGRAKSHSDVILRTRSKERPPKVDTTTEIEDDFEIIRQMHKTKQNEEHIAEARQEERNIVPIVKELKEREVKVMPPLILASYPEEKPRRARPKTLPLKEEVPFAKPRTRSRSRPKRLSTSDDDDETNLVVKSKLVLKPKEQSDIKNEIRKRKVLAKRTPSRGRPDGPEVINYKEPPKEFSSNESETNIGDVGSISKPWFFQRWFSPSGPSADAIAAPVVEELVVQQLHAPETDPIVMHSTSFLHNDYEAEEDIDDNYDQPECTENVNENADVKLDEAPLPPVEPKKTILPRIYSEWREFVNEYRNEYIKIKKLKNRCASDLLIILLFCGLGGFVFRFTEGTFESFYKCGVKRVKRDFIDSLWSASQYMPVEDWKSEARSKLKHFENELHVAHEAGMTSYSGQKSWSFLNAVVYSLTVITTIGYGHISPITATGRAITVIYAIIGIPMFLILLADFGKLFTRGMKFLWVFVRRVYYTGSCKKVRRTVPVQDVMKGMQAVYEFARRQSQMPGLNNANAEASVEEAVAEPATSIQMETSPIDTPAPSQFEINDEFNLPISVAITILVAYILIGATIYNIWEKWSFFECFYFVFISMSTIGFGDFVPNHPMFMMASMVYLVFGLALTSMCINVVQEKLSDTFKQASAKIGATMGLDVTEDLLPEQMSQEPTDKQENNDENIEE